MKFFFLIFLSRPKNGRGNKRKSFFVSSFTPGTLYSWYLLTIHRNRRTDLLEHNRVILGIDHDALDDPTMFSLAVGLSPDAGDSFGAISLGGDIGESRDEVWFLRRPPEDSRGGNDTVNQAGNVSLYTVHHCCPRKPRHVLEFYKKSV